LFNTGNLVVGGSPDAGQKLQVNGTASVQGELTVNTVNIGLGGGAISTNLRVGANALSANTTGTSNVTIGNNSMLNNTTGINNVVVGTEAFYTTTTGSNNNVIVGRQAAYFCTAIVDSIAIGAAALSNALSSQRNVAIGRQSMINSVSGNDNTGVGYRALYGASSATFANNTGIGSGALDQLSSGGNNVGVGYLAGSAIALGGANLTSSNSIYVGYNTKPSLNGNTNEIVIGYNATGLGSNTTVIGNSSTTDTASYGRMLVNYSSPVIGTFALDVNGTARVSGAATFGNLINISVGVNSGLRYDSSNYFYVDAASGFVLNSWDYTIINNVSGTGYGGMLIRSGTTGAKQASAHLQIDSTTKGFLPPRMTTTQKNAISSPAAGLQVYDTTTNKLCCYNGTTWNDLF
jgi:hypothetical protein